MKFRPLAGTPAAAKKPKKKSKWCDGFIITKSDSKFDDELAKSQKEAAIFRSECRKYHGSFKVKSLKME